MAQSAVVNALNRLPDFQYLGSQSVKGEDMQSLMETSWLLPKSRSISPFAHGTLPFCLTARFYLNDDGSPPLAKISCV